MLWSLGHLAAHLLETLCNLTAQLLQILRKLTTRLLTSMGAALLHAGATLGQRTTRKKQGERKKRC